MKGSIAATAFAFSVSLSVLPQAQAASGVDGGLDEVVVTAQKREQNLQQVGVSVSALQGEDLRDLGVSGTTQLGAVLPNVQLNTASGGNYGAQITIRGVANTDFSPHQESPNSMYVDEVYVSAPNAQGTGLFDMARVEALRGPQGTLFGRNSTGGLINFITAKPTSKEEGYFDLTYGEFSEVRIEAAESGPVADGVLGRVAVATQDNSGYVKNHYPGAQDLNGTHYRGIRLMLEYDRIENLKALFTLSYSHDDDHEGFYGHLNTYFDPNNGGRPSPLPANVDAWGTGAGNDIQGYRSPYTGNEGEVSHIGFLHRGLLSPTMHLDWDLGGGTTLTSITNFTKFLFNYGESCDGAPQHTCEDPYSQDLSQWSEELRIAGKSGSLNWVTGAYGLGITQDNGGQFFSPYYSGTPFAINASNPIHQVLHSYALFGQVESMFGDHWRGTLGLRVTHDQKTMSEQTYLREAGDYVSTDTVFNPPLLVADFSSATVGDLAKESNTYLSGKAQMDYMFSKDALLYASVSRGVKGAGFNSNGFGANPSNLIPFKGEHMLAYELGNKLTLFNNHMTVDSDVFFYDYKNFQAFQYRGNGPNPFVSNADAKFSGAEIEIVARPARGLDVRFSLSTMSSTVYDVSTAQVGVRDQQAQDVPKWSGNGLVRYTWAMGQGEAALLWSGDFITGRYHSVDNTPSVYVHGSNGQNIRATYTQGAWSFSAYCNNAFNKVRQTGAYDLTGSYGYTIQTFMPPRWWGVQARVTF